jgi:hypothetical protein
MRNASVICLRWKLTGRIEVFTNLGKLYKKHDSTALDISVHSLRKKNLFRGWHNDYVEVIKVAPNY